MKLFDKTLSIMERSLDVRLDRQTVLAGNLANADTPGFAPKDVDFQVAMASAEIANPSMPPELRAAASAAGTAATPMPEMGAPPTAGMGETPIIDGKGTTPSLDGNSVDVDRTMVAMAQNAIQYGATARAAGKKLAILRYVASDGAG